MPFAVGGQRVAAARVARRSGRAKTYYIIWRNTGRSGRQAGCHVGEGDERDGPEVSGEFRVADDVVVGIAGLAASRVAGVAGLAGGLPLGLGKRGATRGIRLEMGTSEVAIAVYLHVAYGVQIPVVAQRVQEAVKAAVESMTSLRVVEVNVHVQGVDLSGASAAAAPGEPGRE